MNLIPWIESTGQIQINVNSDSNPNYSATFQTFAMAFNKIKELRKDGENSMIRLLLDEGDYRLEKSLKVDPGFGAIEIIGAGKDKTFIKGSTLLTPNWTKYNEQIWVSQLDEGISFDQLYVNGKQQILARYPNSDVDGGHWQGHAADAIAPARVSSWKDPRGAIIHAMHKGEWGGFHFLLEDLGSDGELVLNGGHQNNRPSEMHKQYRMVENVFEELDAPGEWYLAKDSKLYFWPQEGMVLSQSTFEGSLLEELVRIVGNQDQPVKNVRIKGVTFQHSKRTLFKDYEPLLRSDWTIFRGGAVFISMSENVEITSCTFHQLGGNAVFLSDYNKGCQITSNHFRDIGATAINLVGSPLAVRSPSFQYGEYLDLAAIDSIKGPKSASYPSNCLVDNNLIHDTGRIEKQSAGVNISMAMDITVSHNSIYNLPRAGINICDGTWGGHLIEFNDVFNTVLESGDHGAFNSWGRDRFWHPKRDVLDQIVANNPKMARWDAIKTTTIRNNRFRCDHGWDIDLDDGSSNYKIYNNVCLNGGLKLREGLYRIVENNILVNNGFHPHVWFENSEDVFRRNIVMTEHKDIRLAAWGKEIDYNFFPNAEALKEAQNSGVDLNSSFGDPNFIDAEKGNYGLKEGSKVLELGFEAFETVEAFGVQEAELRSLAEQPQFPKMWNLASTKKDEVFTWLGGHIKNIESMEERSAAGLNETSGVLLLSFEDNSILAGNDLREGDVILGGEGEKIRSIPDLMRVYQGHNWKGVLNLTLFRNQKEVEVRLKLKR